MSKLLCNVLKFSGEANIPNAPLIARLLLSVWSHGNKLKVICSINRKASRFINIALLLPFASKATASLLVVQMDCDKVVDIFQQDVGTISLESVHLAVESAVVMLAPSHAVTGLFNRYILPGVNSRHCSQSQRIYGVMRGCEKTGWRALQFIGRKKCEKCDQHFFVHKKFQQTTRHVNPKYCRKQFTMVTGLRLRTFIQIVLIVISKHSRRTWMTVCITYCLAFVGHSSCRITKVCERNIWWKKQYVANSIIITSLAVCFMN